MGRAMDEKRTSEVHRDVKEQRIMEICKKYREVEKDPRKYREIHEIMGEQRSTKVYRSPR